MPIVEVLENQDAPLSQGDILTGLQLFVTNQASGAGRNVGAKGLVISRPCLAVNNDWIVVSLVEQYKNKPPSSFESFEEARTFFTVARDGLSAPDHFYLGQLPGDEGCFCARLNLLQTIEIPGVNQQEERRGFVQASRIGRLSQDFAHDLHLRIFRSYASLGFDDHGWYSTEDLRALVAVAERDESQKQTELYAIQAKLKMGQSQGYHHPSERKKNDEDERKLSKALSNLRSQLQPYKEELMRRERQHSD
jgi:hypothetical protein